MHSSQLKTELSFEKVQELPLGTYLKVVTDTFTLNSAVLSKITPTSISVNAKNCDSPFIIVNTNDHQYQFFRKVSKYEMINSQ